MNVDVYSKDMRVVVVRTVEIYETDETNLNSISQRNFSTNSTGPEFWLYAQITIGTPPFPLSLLVLFVAVIDI
jgi:hypothetical protein